MFCDSSACNRGTPSPITAGSTLLKVPWLEILPPDTNVWILLKFGAMPEL
jgi:hypothetical protein